MEIILKKILFFNPIRFAHSKINENNNNTCTHTKKKNNNNNNTSPKKKTSLYLYISAYL